MLNDSLVEGLLSYCVSHINVYIDFVADIFLRIAPLESSIGVLAHRSMIPCTPARILSIRLRYLYDL